MNARMCIKNNPIHIYTSVNMFVYFSGLDYESVIAYRMIQIIPWQWRSNIIIVFPGYDIT